MTMSVKVGGVWKTVATPSVKVGGVWKTLAAGYVKVGGVWKQFYPDAGGGGGGGGSLTVTGPSGDTTVSEHVTGTFQNAHTVTTDPDDWAGGLGVQVSGGSGTYTYSWTRVSAPTGMTIGFATTNQPYWTAVVQNGATKTEVWRCTVTDSAGATGTVDITVSLSFDSFL